MRSPRLGKGGFYTVADQVRLYEEEMGEAKAAEQVRLQKIQSGKCICDPPMVRKIEGQDRVIHQADCPKHRPWMGEK